MEVGQAISSAVSFLFIGGDFWGIQVSRISNFQAIYRNLHIPAVIIGGAFALLALVLSILLILQHLRSYTNPSEQKWIIGVLFMVPVYASESILSLWKPQFSMVCDILRNCYEAFALYSFGSYLVACLEGKKSRRKFPKLIQLQHNSYGTMLGGEERVVELLEKESKKQLSEQLLREDVEKGTLHRRSLSDFFCQPNVLGKDLYTTVKFGLVQYMILKTLCAFLALLLERLGVYGEGEFKWYYGYPYIAGVINFSQMWALYCLVQFYNVTHHRLRPIKPLPKFISFKAIVFATWWQGVGIAIICYIGVLPKEEKIETAIQDFLICIEMAIAAAAHVYVFSAEPYRYLPVSEHGKVTSIETKAKIKLDEDSEGKPAIVEEAETQVEAPGTSVTESVQDVVMGGGEHVVKDVALTISQAIEPVEKGFTKIQATFHQVSLGSDDNEGGKLEVDEHVVENVEGGESHVVGLEKEVITDEHVTENVKDRESHVVGAEKEVITDEYVAENVEDGQFHVISSEKRLSPQLLTDDGRSSMNSK